jgi:restriction system protein
MAWARTYLKNAGLITNSSRGVWALTPQRQHTDHVDERWVVQQVKKLRPAKAKEKEPPLEVALPSPPIAPAEDQWREDLLHPASAGQVLGV